MMGGDRSQAAAIRTVDLEVSYGRIRALQGVSLSVEEGRITALVGANGAGKSSLLKAVAGLVPVRSGSVESPAGHDVARIPAHRRVRDLGLVLVPEGRAIFGSMTVEENLMFGLRIGITRGRHEGMAKLPSLDEVYGMFPVLEERRSLDASYLSGGEQQMLSLGRALLMEPSILLIDEPSMGLAPLVVREIFDRLKMVLAEKGITVFLVEQDTALALSIADWAYVLERGSVQLDGPAAEVAQMPQLQEVYLGSSETNG